jgi:hypothetical protein
MMKNIKRPVKLENINFLYGFIKQQHEGKEKEHYELKLFKLLPEQGPGKKESLTVGPRYPTKVEALAKFMEEVRKLLEGWKEETIILSIADPKVKGPAK